MDHKSRGANNNPGLQTLLYACQWLWFSSLTVLLQRWVVRVASFLILMHAVQLLQLSCGCRSPRETAESAKEKTFQLQKHTKSIQLSTIDYEMSFHDLAIFFSLLAHLQNSTCIGCPSCSTTNVTLQKRIYGKSKPCFYRLKADILTGVFFIRSPPPQLQRSPPGSVRACVRALTN